MTIEECTDKINAMAFRTDRWNSGGAKAPNLVARFDALHLCEAACEGGLPPNKVKPSVVGGVGVTFRSNRRRIYVEFRNTGNGHSFFYTEDEPEEDAVIKPVDLSYEGLRRLAAEAKAYLEVTDAVRPTDGVDPQP